MYGFTEGVSESCLTPKEQFFSYIMVKQGAFQ